MFKLLVLTLVCVAVNANLMTGGWTVGSISEVTELARWSVKTMSSLSGFEGEYNIQTPKNVRKQVVSGINYKFTLDVLFKGDDEKYIFKSCDLFIFDQPWTNTRYFVEAPVCNIQQFRNLVGGWTQVTAITDTIMNVARLSAKALSTQLSFEGDHTVMVLQNIQTQLVNGMNYKFTVDYLVNLPDNKYIFKRCNLKFNHQPSTDAISFLETPTCQNLNVYNEMQGEWVDGSISEVMDIARWSTKSLSQFTGVEGDHSVLTPRNVKKQLVSGTNYKFTLDVLIRTSDNKYFSKSCDLFIYDQPWTNTRKFVEDPKCVNNPFFN